MEIAPLVVVTSPIIYASAGLRVKRGSPYHSLSNIDMELEILVAKRALGIASPKEHANWAESLLYENITSEYIEILASMGYERDPESEEIEYYFRKAIEESGIVLPELENSLEVFSIAVCEKICAREIKPEYGLKTLTSISYKSSRYIYDIWRMFSGDIESLSRHGCCKYNTGLTLENSERYLESVAKQFIEMLDLDLPRHFLCEGVCLTCSHSEHVDSAESEMKLEPHGWHVFYICSSCKKPNLRSNKDFAARKIYLTKYYG